MTKSEQKRWKELAKVLGVGRSQNKIKLHKPVLLVSRDQEVAALISGELSFQDNEFSEWLTLWLPEVAPAVAVAVETEAAVSAEPEVEIAEIPAPEPSEPPASEPPLSLPAPVEAESPAFEVAGEVSAEPIWNPAQATRAFLRSLPFGSQLPVATSPLSQSSFDPTPTRLYLCQLPWSGSEQALTRSEQNLSGSEQNLSGSGQNLTHSKPPLSLVDMMALATEDALRRSRKPGTTSSLVELPRQNTRQFLKNLPWYEGALSA